METFKPDIGSEELPRFTVMTGAQLRQRHIEKLRVQEQRAMINDAFDPDSLTEEDQAIFNAWLKTMAESKYPDEGDYKVRILEDNGDPVTEFGEEFEFITGVTYTSDSNCNCKAIEFNISQVDLDNAIGNTDPSFNNKVVCYYNICDESAGSYIFDTAGIQYANICTKADYMVSLYFQYSISDNSLLTPPNCSASLSDNCCEELIP